MSDEKLQAFVLIPFKKNFLDLYEKIIQPVLIDTGYEVKIADDLSKQSNIVKTIIENIEEASLIIADITELNGNVMYELGIAHGLLSPTVMITQKIDDIPFDLRNYRCIPYTEDYIGIDKFKEDLKNVAEGRKKKIITFENPVYDFSPRIQKSKQYGRKEIEGKIIKASNDATTYYKELVKAYNEKNEDRKEEMAKVEPETEKTEILVRSIIDEYKATKHLLDLALKNWSKEIDGVREFIFYTSGDSAETLKQTLLIRKEIVELMLERIEVLKETDINKVVLISELKGTSQGY